MSDILERVKSCITDSCGIPASDIQPDVLLIEKLGIDSIDMMDLLYSLETEFGISIKIGEFERLAKADLGDKPFAVDNVITEHGAEVLKKLMPEVPSERIKAGLTVHRIPYLFTVQSLVNMVERKLKQKDG